MSKIALSGNASGTGTFSIVAPNSNTDRTLTLPDEAGTVLVKDVSSPSNAINIDSTGRVTLPYQPCFEATLGANVTGDGSIAGEEVLVFDDARVNVGNHYSTSTGIFTAPVNGNYFVSWNLSPASGSDSARYFRAQLLKNGSIWFNPHNTISDELDNNDYNIAGGSGVIYLTAGDGIKVAFGSSIATTNFIFPAQMNWFSGFLIG